MARTDEPTTAAASRPLGVTVLPSFETPTRPAPRPLAVPAPATDPQVAEPTVAELPALGPVPDRGPAHPPAHAEPRGSRSLLRRRPGRPALVAVPDPAPVVVEPASPGPVTSAGSAAADPDSELAALQAELVRERQRADAAEAATAALRRRVAQLDDELAQFRPRVIVPFEDNTD